MNNISWILFDNKPLSFELETPGGDLSRPLQWLNHVYAGYVNKEYRMSTSFNRLIHNCFLFSSTNLEMNHSF